MVGYSAGGVIARLWVRDLGGDSVARRVVTLGSPHHGTDLAEAAGGILGCPVACQQLAPDSLLLRELNAGDETPEGPAFVSVWTTDDQTVTPPDSAELEGAVNLSVQSVCADEEVSHGDLPGRPGGPVDRGARARHRPPGHTDARRLRRPRRVTAGGARADGCRDIAVAMTTRMSRDRSGEAPRQPGQEVMSRVVKFAQAAPRNTAT